MGRNSVSEMSDADRRWRYPDITPAAFAERPAEKHRLVVPYDITSSSPMEIVAAIGDLCEIVWIVELDNPSLGPMARLLPRLGHVIDTSGLSSDAVVDLLRDEPVDGVIAFTDSQLQVASAIGKSFDLAHNPLNVVEQLIDKYIQRNALEVAGIKVPRFRRIPRTSEATQVRELVGDLTFPLVLKPLRGFSSRNVQVVNDVRALTDLFEMKTSGIKISADDYIVEEYLTGRVIPGMQAIGDYVSVELIVQDGHPTPVAITGKFPLAPPFRESGNFMPHPLDADEAHQVFDLSIDAAHALGVQCGALHAEIKLTLDGPRIIEVNGRVGGGGIDSIFKSTRGYSLTELATRVALGERLELVAEEPARWSGPFTYQFFVQPSMSAHFLRSIAGTKELAGIQGIDSVQVHESPGDEIHWEQGSQGYLAQVGGRVQDRTALFSIPTTIHESLQITYDY